MLRVLKELKGKTSFRPIAEESDRPDTAPEKKVRVGAAITTNLHNGHLDGQPCTSIFAKAFKIYFFCLKISHGIYSFVIHVNFCHEIRTYFS